MEFERVVPRLAMDVDRAGKPRRLGIIEPIEIALPTVGSALDDEVSAAAFLSGRRRVDKARGHEVGADEHAGHPCPAPEQRRDLFDKRVVVSVRQIDVAHLVIGQRPGLAAGHVEQFAVGRLGDGQQAGLTKHTIGEERVRHRPDPVFAHNEHHESVAAHLLAKAIDQPRNLGIKFAAGGVGLWAVGAGPLGGIVEMRQVDAGKLRRARLGGLQKASGDPLRRLDPSDGPPEFVKREVAELVAKRGVERLGVRVAPHRLGAVGIVFRCRQADQIGGRMLRLQDKPGRGP